MINTNVCQACYQSLWHKDKIAAQMFDTFWEVYEEIGCCVVCDDDEIYEIVRDLEKLGYVISTEYKTNVVYVKPLLCCGKH